MKITEQARQDGKDLAREVFAKINVMSTEEEFAEGFLEQVSQEHRTLQQGFGRLLFKIIDHFADERDKGRFDARNQALVFACAELKPIIDKIPMPFI